MPIENLPLKELHNDEHFQYHTEVKDLILVFIPGILKIKPQFDTYLVSYAQENECLKKVENSNLTEKRREAANQRGDLLLGFANAIKSALSHFDYEVIEAAGRLTIPLITRNHIVKKNYMEQTSSIYHLIQELRGDYASDVATIGLENWVNEIEVKNQAVDALMHLRVGEVDTCVKKETKKTRKEIDRAYYEIIKRIDTLEIIETDAVYTDFIQKLNRRIRVYNMFLDQRRVTKITRRRKKE
jgi:hypothetical protein